MYRPREAPIGTVTVDLGKGYSVKFSFNSLTRKSYFDGAVGLRHFDGDFQLKSGDCKGTPNGKLKF